MERPYIDQAEIYHLYFLFGFTPAHRCGVLLFRIDSLDEIRAVRPSAAGLLLLLHVAAHGTLWFCLHAESRHCPFIPLLWFAG